ncbi:retinol dehydrogenase 7-like isoform X2 [Montipora capricornis]|uniref:retinol dehydrogenase 7-like isoform X2 n=1 Tax=Montipora capricornis TaxID=246305 RepID=UPI0035F15512
MDSGVFFSFSSFLLLIISALLSIYLVTCLLPRGKIDIKGKYVLITGCDTGFGRATAIKLDKMGACVLATCLTKEGEHSLKSEASDELKTFQLDVTNSKQIKDVYEEIKKDVSPAGLWGLVNNAGLMCTSPIEWTPLAEFKRSADVNIWGLIDVTKTFLPLIKKAKGRVVNMSSAAGRIAVPLTGAYSLTKYGVEAFSDALRLEMQPWGIKVTMLEPGIFPTNIAAPDFQEKELRKGWNQLSEELKNDYGEEWLEKAIKFVRNLPCNSDISPVVNTIVHGLTSPSPSDRYRVGLDARYVSIPLSFFPAFISDFLINVVFRPGNPRGATHDLRTSRTT